MGEHKYADLFRAMADNKPIEGRRPGGNWVDMQEPWKHVADIDWELRVKSPTITIGGVVLVAPVRKPLRNGQVYYLVSLSSKNTAEKGVWSDDEVDRLRLERGLIQLTEGDARDQAKAMLCLCAGSA